MLKEKLKIAEKEYEIENAYELNEIMYGVLDSTFENPISRRCVRIDLNKSIVEVKKMGFADYIQWSLIAPTKNEKGEIVWIEYDKSDLSLLGDIVEHKDGTCSVYMCEMLKEEMQAQTINDLLEV